MAVLVECERGVQLLAAKQGGVFSRGQALGLGLSRHTIERWRAQERIVALHPGVYRFTSTQLSWLVAVRAAVLAAGPGALASHGSAAALHGLDGFRQGPVHVTIPYRRTCDTDGLKVYRCRWITRSDRRRCGAIAVTSPAVTLLQVSRLVHAAKLQNALDDALARRLLRPQALSLLLGRGLPGSGLLRRQLALWLDGDLPESVAEAAVLRRLLARGVPAPQRQLDIFDRQKRFVGRVDFGYPDARVVVEYDSFRFHGATPRKLASTARRRNRLEALGWRFVVATFEDRFDGGERLAQELTDVLALPRAA